MKNEKLTAADLALYIGQEIQTPYGIRKMVCVFSDTPGVCVCKDDRNCLWDTKFSLLLRPLSDLTEREIQICYSLYFPNLSPWPVTSSICREAWWDSCISPNYSMCRASTGNPSVWRYLLSIGIDLFGWIDTGLAIDKTKMSDV